VATQAKLAVVGDYDASITAHQAIPKALERAEVAGLDWEWVETEAITSETDIAGYDAIWCVPGSPYRNEAGAITSIRHARETGKPFLGTCGGYQHAVLEYARNVLGHEAAGNVETDPDCPMPVIGALTCALRDVSDPVVFVEGSTMAGIYDAPSADEGYFCGYGVNPEYLSLFAETDLTFTAFDGAGDPRGFELRQHPFFMGTAFQPERAALKGLAHPLVNTFARTVVASAARAA
jgi:CTP synthase (UTP-ammonia lyase)